VKVVTGAQAQSCDINGRRSSGRTQHMCKPAPRQTTITSTLMLLLRLARKKWIVGRVVRWAAEITCAKLTT
jgi:hypothetical protein